MFNTCASCGEYDAERKVQGEGKVRSTICTCGHKQNFLSLPLYVVSGASCAGKTTVALEMLGRSQDHIVLDQDILWNSAYDQPETDYQLFRSSWLRLAKNLNQSGRPLVLFGSSIPDQFENLSERKYFQEVYYLALVCDRKELEKRIKSRPAWRNSLEDLEKMLEFNQWFLSNARTCQPAITLLDTTEATVKDTVQALERWLEQHS